ncbi:hypothetical protein HHL16_16525 [Pseudoflavitalea sp. G-6-1-2]|uniref:hypothetical protein n=1 Tax=Pseudoflavitalea sp. G-6-1-2 TaxID=2728841 RepID=UPI00146E8452|nr:hypothetical protein [Pseudoflavitalea sp. G-6-1-2]NML22490.1 hypothetical protein [Pseudoflavitalea sp. G-6-1-2]
MSKQNIQSYDDLLREEAMLRRQLALQQEVVAEKWAVMKQQVAPAAKLISTVGKFTSGGGKGLIATGLNLALGLLLRKTGAPMIRNLATGYVAEKAAGLLSGLFKKKKRISQ